LSKIAEDKSIDPYRNWQEWNGWKSEWCRCRDEEISALDAAATQGLIDLCEGNSVLRSLGVLQCLYDRRHELRQATIAEIRSKHGAMTSQALLTELVTIMAIPISHFPIEIADAVTDDWLETIPEIPRANFLLQLGSCKLRVWIRARKRLSYFMSPNPAVHTDAAR